MGDFKILARRTEPYVGGDCNFGNLSDPLTEYGIPELKHFVVRHYSKLDAIDCHTKDLTPDMARVLLTDQGILFAQTRERGYPTEHNRRLLDSTRYGERPAETGLSLNENSLGDFAASVLNKCRSVLDEAAPAQEPMTKLDKMLRSVLEECHRLEFIASKLYQPGEDSGYVKGATAEEQTDWVDAVMLQFPKRSKPVAAAKWLRENMDQPISDAEMFLFLAYILPTAVSVASSWDNSHRFYQAAGRKPQPVITPQQQEKLNEQIKAFHQKDSPDDALLTWKGAGKLLRLYITLEKSRIIRIRTNITNFSGRLDRCCDLLLTSFEQYFRAIKVKPQRSEEELSTELVNFFFSTTSDGHKPLLIDKPLTIYRIVRSPVHHNIGKLSNVDEIYQMIVSSNSDISFPICKKFLDAEKYLYDHIGVACRFGCEYYGIDYDKGSWENLWECIEQSVNCLSYCYGDLLSPPVLFKSGYHEFRRFFPVLDQWLRDKLSDPDNLFEPTLWRGIYNSFIGTSDEADYNKGYLIPYRHLFTSTKPDLDRLISLLSALAGRFKWNNVTRLPTVEELANAEKKITGEHEKCSLEQLKSFVEIVRRALSEDNAIDAVKDIQLVMTEWILLQQICYQTQFNLFRAIDKAINKNGEYAEQ